MPKPRSSLASHLTELNDVTPRGFDPELSYDVTGIDGSVSTDDASETTSENDEAENRNAATRSHYRESGPSALRRKAALSESDSLNDKKYQGVKTSRKEFMQQRDWNEEDDENEDRHEESGDDEANLSGSDDGYFGYDKNEDETGEHEDGDYDSESTKYIEEVNKGEWDSESENEGDDNVATVFQDEEQQDKSQNAHRSQKGVRFASELENDHVNGKLHRSTTLMSQSEEEAKLLASLRTRSADDAQKGRAVRKQMSGWEAFLETRIRLQKLVKSGGRVEPVAVNEIRPYLSEEKHFAYKRMLSELSDISTTLFHLRLSLLKENNPGLALPTEFEPLRFEELIQAQRKRKRDSGNENIENCETERTSENVEPDSNEALSHDRDVLNVIALESRVLNPLTRSTLQRWSSKVNAASANGLPKQNRFEAKGLRAVNQSAVAQIDAAMQGDGFERLLQRTRVWRAEGDDAKRIGSSKNGEHDILQQSQPDTSNSNGFVHDTNTFDDSDFYSQLLRELIESKGARATVGANASAAMNNALKSTKKPSRTVDTRASKGRRIRYEVNEKIQNFMPPIPRVIWTEAQTDRLFSQLASLSTTLENNTEGLTSKDESISRAEETVDLAGLRVFG